MGELGRTIHRYLGRARTRVPATLLAVAALLASTLVLSAAPPAQAIGPCSINWIGASGSVGERGQLAGRVDVARTGSRCPPTWRASATGCRRRRS